MKIKHIFIKTIALFVVVFLVTGCFKSKEKETKEFIQKYTMHITEEPNSSMWYSGRALGYSELREYDKAIADYKKALSLFESSSDYYYLAMVYLVVKDVNSAYIAINNSIRMKLDSEHYYLIRAFCNDQLSNSEMAIKDYTIYINGHKRYDIAKWEHYFSFVRRAILLMDKGQLGYALNDVNYALKIDQTGDDIYYLKFMIEAKAGQYDASYEDLKKSLKEGFNDREELENFVSAIPNIDKTKVNEIVAKYIDDDLKNGFDFYNWDYIIKKSFNIIK